MGRKKYKLSTGRLFTSDRITDLAQRNTDRSWFSDTVPGISTETAGHYRSAVTSLDLESDDSSNSELEEEMNQATLSGASAKKILPLLEDPVLSDEDDDSGDIEASVYTSANMIFGVRELEDCLQGSAVCSKCLTGKLSLVETTCRKGWGTQLMWICSNADCVNSAQVQTFHSTKCIGNTFDINRLLVLGLRLGKPDFMKQKRARTSCKLKRGRLDTSTSDANDPDWIPSMDWEEVCIRKSSSAKKRKKSNSFTVMTSRNGKKKSPVIPEDSESLTEKELFTREIRPSSKLISFVATDEEYFFYCSECGIDHVGQCLEHAALMVINDTQVSADSVQRAWHTLPPCLSVRQSGIQGAGLGVWSNGPIPKRTRFGPYEGDTITDPERAEVSGYCWKIGKTNQFVDGENQRTSNWLRYVNCCRTPQEQNLMAYQYRGQIFYKTIKSVPMGRELLVWYGEEYGRDMGINPDGMNKCANIERSKNSVTMVSRRKRSEKEMKLLTYANDGTSESILPRRDERRQQLKLAVPTREDEQTVTQQCKGRRIAELERCSEEILSEFVNRSSKISPVHNQCPPPASVHPAVEPRIEFIVIVSKLDEGQITLHGISEPQRETNLHSENASTDNANPDTQGSKSIPVQLRQPTKKPVVVSRLSDEQVKSGSCCHSRNKSADDCDVVNKGQKSTLPESDEITKELVVVIRKLTDEQITGYYCTVGENSSPVQHFDSDDTMLSQSRQHCYSGNSRLSPSGQHCESKDNMPSLLGQQCEGEIYRLSPLGRHCGPVPRPAEPRIELMKPDGQIIQPGISQPNHHSENGSTDNASRDSQGSKSVLGQQGWPIKEPVEVVSTLTDEQANNHTFYPLRNKCIDNYHVVDKGQKSIFLEPGDIPKELIVVIHKLTDEQITKSCGVEENSPPKQPCESDSNRLLTSGQHCDSEDTCSILSPSGQHCDSEDSMLSPSGQHCDSEDSMLSPSGQHCDGEDSMLSPTGQHCDSEDSMSSPVGQHCDGEATRVLPSRQHLDNEERVLSPSGQHCDSENIRLSTSGKNHACERNRLSPSRKHCDKQLSQTCKTFVKLCRVKDVSDFTDLSRLCQLKNTSTCSSQMCRGDDCSERSSENITLFLDCDSSDKESVSRKSSPRSPNKCLQHKYRASFCDFNQTLQLYTSLNQDAQPEVSMLQIEKLAVYCDGAISHTSPVGRDVNDFMPDLPHLCLRINTSTYSLQALHYQISAQDFNQTLELHTSLNRDDKADFSALCEDELLRILPEL